MFIKVMMLMMLIELRVFATDALVCSVTNSVSGVFNFGIDVIEYQ